MRMPFDLDQSTVVRAVVAAALMLMLWGFFAPLVQLRQSGGAVVSAQSFVHSFSFVDKASMFVLFGIGVACLASAVTERYEYLGRLAYVAFLITTALFLLHIIGYIFDGRFSLALFIPAWFFWGPHLAFGYAWTLLIGSAGLLCYAAFLAGEAPELMALQSRIETVTSATAARRQQTPGTTYREYTPPSRGISLFWKFVAGYLIFTFCSTFPPLGYFLWKFLDEESSPHTTTALVGCILGGIFWAGIFLLSVLSAMAQVGK
ncbi:MAG TPA: hypothetical protein VF681_06805 [Abditibacteriaceae bacterium]|jgi:hypothetical protein